ncbi:sulfatase family protein [Armatimonas rosea]|uniref:Arylsulfatase A-like enzyme n=1 Tax=Armatimonas rosea TaxID=685828 RepID=A0A7W9W5E3_ARMRO|nr:sulfatase [Armatimonas rosea]MBB6048976.1 arylsulfatase A-like enzyme [Armatimonas rosea]
MKNVVFVFSDQWRWCDHGYTGNKEVATPHLDALARESVHFTHAIATMPVCSPWRASFLTGQYPLTHGLFLNDLRLNHKATSLAEAFGQAGYDTAWIGKWHLDGTGRSQRIPKERRQGFDHWRVLECTHNYLHSEYFAGDETQKRTWPGYDAYAQTDEALAYLQSRPKDKPFLLCLSFGPPHDPYRMCPEELLKTYDAKTLSLRPNVPDASRADAQKTYAGYYAHIAALDQCVGKLLAALKASGQLENTVFVYTSDHGDMLHSHGMLKKQKPWDESIRVPLLIRLPGGKARTIEGPIGTPDLMPTLLGLCGLPVPATVEGRNLAAVVQGKRTWDDDAALILCAVPFGEWLRRNGGREYRGIRTVRYTYVRDLSGPWLLYDNREDPYQLTNRANDPALKGVQAELEKKLAARLKETGDDFASADTLIARCGYKTDANGTVDYANPQRWGQETVKARV